MSTESYGLKQVRLYMENGTESWRQRAWVQRFFRKQINDGNVRESLCTILGLAMFSFF